MDRSGYARGTLAPRPDMSAPVPRLRERPVRTMLDMGMDHGGGEHAGHAAGGQTSHEHGGHGSQSSDAPMDHGGMPKESPVTGRHGPEKHGPENQMVAEVQRNRLGEPGTGLENVGHRVLVYTDLKALAPSLDPRPPEREIEFHLTGNMEAFVWGMDGHTFSESGEQPKLRVGERVRFTLVNDTMMEHPMHLHGVFLEIVNGTEVRHQPRKHTINVKPAERLSFDFTYDEPGNFAFHCHVLYHMEMGMFRFVNVSGRPTRRLT
jgi:FtsP/CotA-like multicopper oxidase with cupredoxin domain